MPMIAGRYYMNPAHGRRLEEARRAEEQDEARKSPVRHVEIECADGGYVTRVHRHAPPHHPEHMAAMRPSEDMGDIARQAQAPAAHTHIFTNHSDLIDFLREELGREA